MALALEQSWYRVAKLRPRPRLHARVHRQRGRGGVWYVPRDHQTGNHFRLSAAGMWVELVLAGLASSAWALLDPGPARIGTRSSEPRGGILSPPSSSGLTRGSLCAHTVSILCQPSERLTLGRLVRHGPVEPGHDGERGSVLRAAGITRLPRIDRSSGQARGRRRGAASGGGFRPGVGDRRPATGGRGLRSGRERTARGVAAAQPSGADCRRSRERGDLRLPTRDRPPEPAAPGPAAPGYGSPGHGSPGHDSQGWRGPGETATAPRRPENAV
jgi:hypothetical protein